ncbi:MAG: hypothetical protein E4H40_05140, partial [Candidatus Brocadiia bacterium]
MIRITHLTLPFDHKPDALKSSILKYLNIAEPDLLKFTIVRRSIDARRKNRIVAVYAIDVEANNEPELISAFSENQHIAPTPDTTYKMPSIRRSPSLPPVVIGSGPCGLFAALVLAQLGCKPLLIERGKDGNSRIKDVNNFWRNGQLDSESNVQFGEGGAGTFSDGKLTTQIRDKNNRSRKVLEEFVNAGAPEEIL